jgi:phenylpropionate dioxygenase-like ring-hydroxylating dioxygenase large terminal subunit
MDTDSDLLVTTLDPIVLEPLLDAVVSGANQPIEKAQTLPPTAYTSAAFYALEVERIFKKEWLCVGHVSQVAKEGDYFTIDLMGEMLVVVRGKDDRVRVLSRICLHRWAPLVNGSGNVKLFSCPFHKWGFALDGRLLGAPLMDGIEFDIASCKLPEFRHEIVDGFIYVNFSKEAPSLGPQIAEMSAEIAKFGFEDLVIAGTLTYDCKINWKIVVETFMECYHHIAAHPETFEEAFPARMSWVEDGRKAWTVGHAEARKEVPDEAIRGGFPDFPDQTDLEKREFRLYLVYPYHLFNILPDRIFWFCLQPTSWCPRQRWRRRTMPKRSRRSWNS